MTVFSPQKNGRTAIQNKNCTNINVQRHTLKGKRKVQEVPQSQAAALPRHQEEEETYKT